MKTVQEVSAISGVSVRTLHYYDEIGLLTPTALTEAGYRLYDDAALERLQGILLFRELRFSLKDIRAMLDAPNFDRARALEQQTHLLELQRERIDGLIVLARRLQTTGGTNPMDFSAFDTAKLDEYAAEAKKRWGGTEAYREYQQKTEGQSNMEQKQTMDGLMAFFARFGALRDKTPESPEAQALAKELQGYITAHFYTCTPQIFAGLGAMYAAGGEMTDNIDKAGGSGTAAFAAAAIAAYCSAR